MKYTSDGILIEDRTKEENRYTDLWYTPVDFEKDAGNGYSNEQQYKATVVKVRAYSVDEQCWSEKIWTNTYLIDPSYTMSVMSLTVSEELLFDEETGIYMPGAVMEEYLRSEQEKPEDKRLWKGNYSNDQKVSGNLEYFVDGQRVMEDEVTLRICGAASRGNAQKSFAVYAWGKDNQFSYPVFGDKYTDRNGNVMEEFSSLRLRAFGNDWRRSMFRDALSQELVKDLDLGTQAYRPCILLINGEYFGIYEIRENRDSEFYERHFGISQGNLAKVDVNELSDDTADCYGEEFIRLVEYAETTDLNSLENYEWLEQHLDIEQFIDYMITQQYLYNIDWPPNNTIVFRSIDASDHDGSEDGRWRFLLYDLDYAIYDEETDNFSDVLTYDDYVSVLLRSLLKCDRFRTAYCESFEELLSTYFETSRALEILNRFNSEFLPEIEEALSRWNIYEADGTPVEEKTLNYWKIKMSELETFFVDRPAYARTYFYGSLQ